MTCSYDRTAAQRVAARFLAAGATVRFHGKMAKYSKVIYAAFVDFMGVAGTVHLYPRKFRDRSTIGYVDSAALDSGTVNVYFRDGSVPATLANIGHELTHVLQYKRGDLAFADDQILWKHRPAISGDDYASLNQSEHAQLPWEKEAVANGKGKAQAFMANIKDLRGRDPTLDFLIDKGFF